MRDIHTEPVETPFAVFIWGGREKFDRRRSILKLLTTNPIFSKRNASIAALARRDAWTKGAIQSRELIKLKLEYDWTPTHVLEAVRSFLDHMLPVQPQFMIFMSNLERQMSDEQKAIWIPRTERFEIFGSYAQTELGHGSNVRGIETTATFDAGTDEFIINSPTISSTKYWIGATGVWATHSIVVAKLRIGGENYGNHLFLTQLRNLDTHELMPGVEIYELGPKVFQAMLCTDNGALRFHNVRIPRAQMLCRNAQVLSDGTYITPKNLMHSYGSMVTVRATMAEITGWDLLKAVAIAYHYTTFRKQFWAKQTHSPETTVFDYASVRYRLLPLLAQGIALTLVGRKTKLAYDEYTETYLKNGDATKLENLHLRTVGAKIYATEITSKGIEICRIACGGHGFHSLSGFGRLYANTVNAVTYEGDNYVIAKQVSRAIMKHWNADSETSLTSLSYLSTLRKMQAGKSNLPCVSSSADWLARSNQQWVLEHRLGALVQTHIQDTHAGKDTSFSSHALAMAHSDFTYWRGLWEVVDDIADSCKYREPVEALAQVFSLHILYVNQGSLATYDALTDLQRGFLAEAYDGAIDEMASKHVAKVIDALGFTEYEMESALARADKDPYESLLEGAQKSDLNDMQHLWPMLVETRSLWKHMGFESRKAKL